MDRAVHQSIRKQGFLKSPVVTGQAIVSEDCAASSEREGGQFVRVSLIVVCGVMSDIVKEVSMRTS